MYWTLIVAAAYIAGGVSAIIWLSIILGVAQRAYSSLGSPEST